MALDRNQLLKVHIGRLVASLCPPGFGDEYVSAMSNELYAHIAKSTNVFGGASNSEHHELLSRFQQYFTRNGLRDEWPAFELVLERLIAVKSLDQVLKYLVFLNGLNEQQSSHQKQQQEQQEHQTPHQHQRARSTLSQSFNLTQLSGSNYSFGGLGHVHGHGHGAAAGVGTGAGTNGDDVSFRSNLNPNHPSPLAKTIEPYYPSLDEATIIKYLSYTLLGLDSMIFVFSEEGDEHLSIQLPNTVNHSYSALLHSILEPALINKKLSTWSQIQALSYTQDSPLKTSFLRILEKYLNFYTASITDIFNCHPSSKSLISIKAQLTPLTLNLRVLYTIQSTYFHLTGYDFLSKIYTLSKFGDSSIKAMSSDILLEISQPYFETLQTWILKGELIDNCNEFFIRYNVEGQDFNDIIEFLPERIPNETFLNFNRSLGEKIFQIGKSLIFLEKYCKELKWVHDFGRKYSERLNTSSGRILLMKPNEFHSFINDQYNELLGYIFQLLKSKYRFFEHIRNFKSFLLMNSNDFIESLINKGLVLFNEPANSLTINQLTKVLVDSINSSSVINVDAEFQNRLDVRILNLNRTDDNFSGSGNGAIGWEVFTLEYKINDLPIENILNYHEATTGYLKMFNFLWKVRNLTYLLNSNFVESFRLSKDDLRTLQQSYRKSKIRLRKDNSSGSVREKKVVWIMKSFNRVCIIKNQLLAFLNILTRYLSLDIIERKYKEFIIDRMQRRQSIKINNIQEQNRKSKILVPGAFNNSCALLKPSETYMKNLLGHGNSDLLTIDQFILTHNEYLDSILNCKLLDGNVIGQTSGEALVTQIFDLMEISFQFIKGSEEFNGLLVKYVSILNIDEQRKKDLDIDLDTIMIDELEDDLGEIEENLKNIITKLHKELYFNDFKPRLDLFKRDLRSILDLKELSKMI